MRAPTTALVLLLTAAAPFAPTPGEDHQPLPALVVGGSGEATAAPDRAVVSLGAAAQAPSAVAAQQQVNQALQGTLKALRDAGVPERSLQTDAVSLHPVYSDVRVDGAPGDGDPRIVGYRASHTIRVELDGTAQVGAVIDAGIGSGANRLEGLVLELRDDAPQRAEALRLAVEDARAKARALADAAGVELLALRRIEEGGVQTLGTDATVARMALESGTPVQLGRVRVTASVTLTYAIGPRADDGRQGR